MLKTAFSKSLIICSAPNAAVECILIFETERKRGGAMSMSYHFTRISADSWIKDSLQVKADSGQIVWGKVRDLNCLYWGIEHWRNRVFPRIGYKIWSKFNHAAVERLTFYRIPPAEKRNKLLFRFFVRFEISWYYWKKKLFVSSTKFHSSTCDYKAKNCASKRIR